MDLLRRFTLGDIDAFETLVHQIQASIYAWIVRIVRDPGVETIFELFSWCPTALSCFSAIYGLKVFPETVRLWPTTITSLRSLRTRHSLE